MIAEEFIDFRRELSALVVRSPSGQAVAYPVSESVQRNGVCVETTTPAPGWTDDRAVADPAAGARHRPRAGGGRAARRRADGAPRTAPWWSTSSPCVRTTPATGASTARTRRSSRTTCAPCSTCRWATRRPRAVDGDGQRARRLGRRTCPRRCCTASPGTGGCGSSCTARRCGRAARSATSPRTARPRRRPPTRPARRRLPDGRTDAHECADGAAGRHRDGLGLGLAGDGGRRARRWPSSGSRYEADVVSAHRMPEAMIDYGRRRARPGAAR